MTPRRSSTEPSRTGSTPAARSRLLGFLRRWAWLALALVLFPVALVIFGRPPPGDLPLPDGPLKAAALPMLARAGVAGTPIVVREGSCAWGTVAGLDGTQRIVISRATLAYPLPQALWTIAHEAGHVRLGDPLLGVIVGWVWIATVLAAGQFAGLRGLARFGGLGLALAPLAVALVWGAGLPAFNLIQRQVERRADRYGVDLAGSGAAAAEMIETSSHCMGVHPRADFFETLFRLNHDPPAQRIAMLRAMDR